MEMPFDPAIPLLGLYPKNPESPIQQNPGAPVFVVLFIVVKCWKQPKCPSMNDWIKNLWCTYTIEYRAAERKKEFLLPFGTAWMELESIVLSEVSQVTTDKYHMISPITGT